MEERNTEGLPIVKRGDGWQPSEQRKRTFLASKSDLDEHQEEKHKRRPVPLPFGSIDVFA